MREKLRKEIVQHLFLGNVLTLTLR